MIRSRRSLPTSTRLSRCATSNRSHRHEKRNTRNSSSAQADPGVTSADPIPSTALAVTLHLRGYV